eukprot:2594725-Prymnesium_polylepis.1
MLRIPKIHCDSPREITPRDFSLGFSRFHAPPPVVMGEMRARRCAERALAGRDLGGCGLS